MTDRSLASINVESGVSAFGNGGFCLVTAVADDGTTFTGQLDPTVVRTMALDWLNAAEAAEHDAAVYDVLGYMLDDKEKAARFIAMLRERRAAALTRGDTPCSCGHSASLHHPMTDRYCTQAGCSCPKLNQSTALTRGDTT